MNVTFPISLTLYRRDYANVEAFEEAIDEAVRDTNAWAIRKTNPDMRQWIVDVLDLDRTTQSCAFAYKVELLGGVS